MQKILQQMMAKNGEIKRDIEARFFGEKKPSRGYYIVIPEGGVWHLHHDGLVKQGVNADSETPAFWPTKNEAQKYFDEWRTQFVRQI